MRLDTLTIPGLFRQAVERTPERPAIIHTETDERTSYRELRAAVDEVAAGLAARNVEAGDHVAICLRNVPEHCIVFLACQELGAVAVPFNFRLETEGVRYTLEDSDPSVFVFGEAIREQVAVLHDEVPVETFVAVGGETPPFAEAFASLRTGDREPPSVTVTPEDRSVIQYSSGTTGDPKGIKLDHLAGTTRVLTNAFGQRFRIDSERMLGVMPLYHTVGLHGIFCNMIALSGTYLCQPSFDPGQCVRTIERYGVTALHEAPTIFNALVDTDEIEACDVDSVRVLTYSGAPMDSTLFERVRDEFDPDYLSNNYGCTEAYGPLGQLDLLEEGDPTETGRANMLQATRIVELDSEDPAATVEQGEEGELIVSMDSPTVFSGYLDKPARTAAVIHDGWFFTGDVAYETDDGHTVITGRTDNMIISGGENIYPAEIEDVLAGHPAVDDVGVVGVEDDKWGEVPKAYVIADEGVQAEELDTFCKESSALPDFKRPRVYDFIDRLPRNPSGKIQRYKLRDE